MPEPVVLGAWLPQVADSGGPALMPGQQVVSLVVQGMVAAPWERTFSVPQSEPVPHGLREPITRTADLQWCAVPWIHEHPVERIGAVGHEIPGHGSRDGAVTVQHGGLVRGTEESEHRDGDQNFGARSRTVGEPLWCCPGVVRSVGSAAAAGAPAAAAEGGGGEKVCPQLGECALLVRPLEAAGDGGIAVPDRLCLIRRQVR